MAPAELSHDDISSVFEEFAHADRVVAALAIILRILLFGRGLGCLIVRGSR